MQKKYFSKHTILKFSLKNIKFDQQWKDLNWRKETQGNKNVKNGLKSYYVWFTLVPFTIIDQGRMR